MELTFSNRPFIDNIQCVPDIVNEKLRVVAEVEADDCTGWKLAYVISERASGRKVAGGDIRVDSMAAGGLAIADFTVDMKEAQLWTPESPFLYELTLNTGADEKRVRFGMRSFRFDAERKVALLNEKPRYLRGTNVCIYRFFEDPDRGVLPWDAQWPVTLHERFKDMHWEIARYCIGFPPERWYDVCDSLGFMVQDEFPIWWGIDHFEAPQIAEEYRRWMRERWNHPSVVIWDAQNETVTRLTGEALRQVRDLDLSNRPWENGWSKPDRPTDPAEAHPYLFIKFCFDTTFVEPEEGYRKNFFGTVRKSRRDDTLLTLCFSLRAERSYTRKVPQGRYFTSHRDCVLSFSLIKSVVPAGLFDCRYLCRKLKHTVNKVQSLRDFLSYTNKSCILIIKIIFCHSRGYQTWEKIE